MNRFAIFHLLALFCISFAPASQANRQEVCKLKPVVEIYGGEADGVYRKGDMRLYKNVKANKTDYAVVIDSRQLGEDFEITRRNTVVFEDQFTIKHTHSTMRLPLDINAFTFYENNIFPFDLDKYSNCIPATRASVGGKINRDISFIKTMQMANGEWIVVAQQDKKARLIFPVSLVRSEEVYLDLRVCLTLKFELVKIMIFIDFHQPLAVYNFQSFLTPKIH